MKVMIVKEVMKGDVSPVAMFDLYVFCAYVENGLVGEGVEFSVVDDICERRG